MVCRLGFRSEAGRGREMRRQPSVVARAFRHHLMGSHGFLDFDSQYPRAPCGLKRADYFICSPRILIEQKDIRTKNLKSIGRKLEDILASQVVN
jgi:hypothetical protein